MRRIIGWLWNTGVLSNFMAGLFVILPIVLTVAVIGWVGGKIGDLTKKGTLLRGGLDRIGLAINPDGDAPWLVGAVLVLAAIWALGFFVKATARHKFDDTFNAAVNRIPVINSIYKPISQVVTMLKKDDKSDIKRMKAVFCTFGTERGGGFLALMPSAETYWMNDQDYHMVYVPTSPVPMSGGLIFVPRRAIQPIEMSVDDVMKIYFSLGLLSSQIVPESYRRPPAGA